VQTHPQTCRMKEGNNRLSLTFEKVKSVKKAKEVLEAMWSKIVGDFLENK
jgi:hypothetical protein